MRKTYPELTAEPALESPAGLVRDHTAAGRGGQGDRRRPPGQKFAGVESVKDGQQTVEADPQVATCDLARVPGRGRSSSSVASVLLIANTIRLSIFSRRREIEVMKLVGATNWFVRGPFMLEGLLCGLVGSIAAVVLLFLGKEVALPAIIRPQRTLARRAGLSFSLIALTLIGVGLAVGALGSGMTLRRFLRSDACAESTV